MAISEEALHFERTVIVAFDEADYQRLLLVVDDLGVALSTYIEDATLMRINQTREEKGEAQC